MVTTRDCDRDQISQYVVLALQSSLHDVVKSMRRQNRGRPTLIQTVQRKQMKKIR